MSYDLEDAREHYFAAGGLESDIGPRQDPGWYWRRAAKLWRMKNPRETRTVAVMSGSDWTDASCTHMKVPNGLNLEAEHAAWRVWYETVFCKQAGADYVTFARWLIQRGAKDAEVEEFVVW